MAYYNPNDGSINYQYGGQEEIDTSRPFNASSFQPSEGGYNSNHTQPPPQGDWPHNEPHSSYQPQPSAYAPQPPFQGYSNPGTTDGRSWGVGDGLYAASAPTATVSNRSWNLQGQQNPPNMSQMTPQHDTFGYYQQPTHTGSGFHPASLAPVHPVMVPQQYYPQQPVYPMPDQPTTAPFAYENSAPNTTQPSEGTEASQHSGTECGRLALEVHMHHFTNDPIYRARILALRQQGASTATAHDSTVTAASAHESRQSDVAHAGPAHPDEDKSSTIASNHEVAPSKGPKVAKSPFDDDYENELSDSDGWNE